jgi:hypothetical protein
MRRRRTGVLVRPFLMAASSYKAYGKATQLTAARLPLSSFGHGSWRLFSVKADFITASRIQRCVRSRDIAQRRKRRQTKRCLRSGTRRRTE